MKLTKLKIFAAFLVLASFFAWKAQAQSIQQINVVVKQVSVRTDTGAVIAIPNSQQSLDLAAMATTDGVELTIPGSGQVVVTEVLVRLKDEGHNEVTFDDSSNCKLKTGKDLVLSTSSPLVLEAGLSYTIHAAFGALSIEANRGGHLHCSLSGTTYEITGVDFNDAQ